LQWALELHKDQKYGEHSYSRHILQVLETVETVFPDDVDLQVAACLHDSLEDTDVSLEEIWLRYGDRVSQLVTAVTAREGSRRSRHAVMLDQLKSFPAAIPLKLADRVNNVSECWRTQNSLLFVYHREHRTMRDALYRLSSHDSGCFKLWSDLDKLLGYTR
jgi:(p)ppGpp synthase/HD superfamily hydrolase